MAADQADIDSTIAAVAVTVAVSLGLSVGLSVAVALSENDIANTVTAKVDGVNFVDAQTITIHALRDAEIDTAEVAVSIAIVASIGGRAVLGGGADGHSTDLSRP